jgi:hypothetical protein
MGLGQAKAAQIKAALNWDRGCTGNSMDERPVIDSP